MIELGTRLPEILFNKVHDNFRRVLHTRTCQVCNYKWPTVEVVLVNDWKGEKFDCCVVHNTIGKAITHIGITQALTGKMYSFGLHKVTELGGYYRRRECRTKVRTDEVGLVECGARWTTAEFLAEGIVCEDVQKCAKCGSVESRIERRRRSLR